MKQEHGYYFPDHEHEMPRVMGIDHGPIFAGKRTYQFRKFAAGFHFIKNFRHAVDIGANVGLWTNVLARCFGYVSCFEPLKIHHECFVKNVSGPDESRIALYPVALGNEKGVVNFQVDEKNTGSSFIVGSSDSTMSAPIDRLDSFDLRDVDFIKIDVEGFEQNVLLGGEQTIRKYKPTIIIEQKPNTPLRFGFSQYQAIETLQSWGAKKEWEYGGDFLMRWKK